MLILCEWGELKARGIKKNALGRRRVYERTTVSFPFHLSSVAIEKKKVVVNWSALPFIQQCDY